MIGRKTILLVVLVGLVLLAGCIDSGSNQGNTANKFDGEVILYKTPYCGCCSGYVEYLEKNGYKVKVEVMDNIDGIKEKYGIPYNYRSCHTAIFGNYFVEGHVPIEAVEKLLSEKPDIDGIALPGMPAGSPGMSGVKTQPFEIMGLKDGKGFLYTRS